jgi:hypothetical protein
MKFFTQEEIEKISRYRREQIELFSLIKRMVLETKEVEISHLVNIPFILYHRKTSIILLK